MRFDENLAAVHAYLCADGYVIRNPITQKQTYYAIGFRNTNLILLRDFQKRFFQYFNVEPHLCIGQRCRIGSKGIYEKLTKEFGSFYSYDWKIPNVNKKLIKVWLRAYFDCEGWVFCKTHQNRHIGIDSVNERGLNEVKRNLENLGIKTTKKKNIKRKIFRLLIYGKENIVKFEKEIGFLHPQKKEKLRETISDFVEYHWNILADSKEIKKLLEKKIIIKKPYIARIFSKEELNLINLSKLLNNFYRIQNIKIHERFNGIGTRYFELDINKKEEIKKLLKHKLINPIQLTKIDWRLLNNERKNKKSR